MLHIRKGLGERMTMYGWRGCRSIDSPGVLGQRGWEISALRSKDAGYSCTIHLLGTTAVNNFPMRLFLCLWAN